MAKYKQKPLQNLHGANVPKTSRQMARESKANKPTYAGTGRVYLGVDPAPGPDETVMLTLDSLSAISDTGYDIGYDENHVDRRPDAFIPEEVTARVPLGIVQGHARAAAAHAAEFAIAYGAGQERINVLINEDFSRLEQRIHAMPPMRNYPIQATTLSMESFAQAMRDAAPSLQDFEDAVRSAVMAFTVPNLAQNLPKNRAQVRKPDHPDTGKVIRRPARSYAGLLIEEVRQADGSVARRIRTNPPK